MYSFYCFFSKDIEYPNDLRKMQFNEYLFNKDLDKNPNNLQYKIISMYNLLEKYYTKRLQESNSSDIINHFKLQIKYEKL